MSDVIVCEECKGHTCIVVVDATEKEIEAGYPFACLRSGRFDVPKWKKVDREAGV